MKVAIAKLESLGMYSQSRMVSEPKLEKENFDDYERRNWWQRMHLTDDGYLYIPANQFKQCLMNVAKYLSMQIKGKGKATYTKHFKGGIIVIDPIVLPYKKEDALKIPLFVPSDGRTGGGSRVLKFFPHIKEWEGDLKVHILDETITRDVFLYHLEQAGQFIGIGQYRPQNGGDNGRFKVVKLDWDV